MAQTWYNISWFIVALFALYSSYELMFINVSAIKAGEKNDWRYTGPKDKKFYWKMWFVAMFALILFA